jgi:hypothetical protein
VAEFRAAREDRDVEAGKELYRFAAEHDTAWPGEPSLVDCLLVLHADAILKAVA